MHGVCDGVGMGLGLEPSGRTHVAAAAVDEDELLIGRRDVLAGHAERADGGTGPGPDDGLELVVGWAG